jgi:hypothetical protein
MPYSVDFQRRAARTTLMMRQILFVLTIRFPRILKVEEPTSPQPSGDDADRLARNGTQVATSRSDVQFRALPIDV